MGETVSTVVHACRASLLFVTELCRRRASEYTASSVKKGANLLNGGVFFICRL